MSLQQQMSLFQEGGLEQDGGTVDPVSGNEVPVGSAQEEVRDDIPAQLSEGEFVFPADVVRFIGLEKLMMMRQEAKAGLKRMEEMGQMGNSEEATMPDDMPFTMDDLDMEDDPQEMAQGGVMAANGVFTQPSKFQRTPIVESAQQPANQPMADEQATFYGAPTQTTEQQPIASFEDLFGGDVSYGYDELRKYVGPNGEIEYIAFKGGEPLPAYTQKLKELTDKGFTYEDPTKVEEDPTDVRVDTAQVTQKEDREGDSTSFQNMQQRENNIQESYRNAIRKVMEDNKEMSAKEAVQFIKDGNYTVMGKKVPGFLFPDIKLANQSRNQKGFIPFSLEEAAKQVQQQITSAEQFNEQDFVDGVTDSPVEGTIYRRTLPGTLPGSFTLDSSPFKSLDGSTIGSNVNTSVSGGLPPADQVQKELAADDKPFDEGPPSLSDKPIQIPDLNFVNKPDKTGEVEETIEEFKNKMGQGIQDPSQIKQTQKIQEEAIKKAAQKAMQDIQNARKDEIEKNQAKARQETAREKMQKQTPYKSGGRFGGFKAGGIASKKPKKKKVMKRGGLASKK